jgi:hypothetical protein
MKHVIFSLVLVALSLLSFSIASAQDVKPSCNPYWVVEGNVKTPKQSTVYFYSADHQLMYKEQVEGRKLNIRRKKVVQQLNEALKETAVVWSTEKQVKENEQILAKRF